MDLIQILLVAVVTVYLLVGLGLAIHAHGEERKTGIKVSVGKILPRIFVGPIAPIIILPPAVAAVILTPQVWFRPYLIPFGKRLWKRISAVSEHI